MYPSTHGAGSNTKSSRGPKRVGAFQDVADFRNQMGSAAAGMTDLEISNLMHDDMKMAYDNNVKNANEAAVTHANQLAAARSAAARAVNTVQSSPLFTPLVVRPNIFTDPYYGYRPVLPAPIVHKHYDRAPPPPRARSPAANNHKEKERRERERSREKLQREREKLQHEREKAKEKLQRERDRSRERMKKEKARNKK